MSDRAQCLDGKLLPSASRPLGCLPHQPVTKLIVQVLLPLSTRRPQVSLLIFVTTTFNWRTLFAAWLRGRDAVANLILCCRDAWGFPT